MFVIDANLAVTQILLMDSNECILVATLNCVRLVANSVIRSFWLFPVIFCLYGDVVCMILILLQDNYQSEQHLILLIFLIKSKCYKSSYSKQAFLFLISVCLFLSVWHIEQYEKSDITYCICKNKQTNQ